MTSYFDTQRIGFRRMTDEELWAAKRLREQDVSEWRRARVWIGLRGAVVTGAVLAFFATGCIAVILFLTPLPFLLHLILAAIWIGIFMEGWDWSDFNRRLETSWGEFQELGARIRMHKDSLRQLEELMGHHSRHRRPEAGERG